MAARRNLRALGLAPGAASMRLAIEMFRAEGGGIVTSCDDGLLPLCARLIGDDEELPVKAFGEVVTRYLTLCDEAPGPLAKAGHFQAAVAEACERLDPDSYFDRCKSFPGFHQAVARTFREIRRWGIESQALERAATGCSEPTSRKLLQLAWIESEARDTLRALGREMSDEHLLQAMDCEPATGSKIGRTLMFASADDHPMAMQWAKQASEAGAEIVICLERCVGGANEFQRGARIAEQAGVVLEPIGTALPLASALFTQNTALANITVRSCADALAEAEWAIRGCLRFIGNGVSLGRIAIYARDLEAYAPMLQSMGKRHGVPVVARRRVPVLTNRFARLALEALEFCASNDVRAIAPLLRCTYLGLSPDQQEAIRLKVRESYRSKNALPILLGWSEQQRLDHQWLNDLLQWRSSAASELISANAWSQRLRTLVHLLPWHQPSEFGPTRVRDMRAAQALQRAVSTWASVHGVRGNRGLSLAEFCATCRKLWEAEEYTIPAEGNGIEVVGDAAEIGEAEVLFAVGMLEGVFPRRRSEEPILNDSDRVAISNALRLSPPLPTSFDKAASEREEFIRLCSSATDEIVFSYPLTDEDRDNVRAFYLTEVKRATGRKDDLNYPRLPLAPPLGEGLSPADRLLREALDSPREEPLPNKLASEEMLRQIAWTDDEGVSPHDLRRTQRCEFEQFAASRLKINSGRNASRWSRLIRLPSDVKLLHQPNPQSARAALETALEATLEEMVGEAAEWEIALLRGGGKRLINEWVDREFMARELWPREPDTVKVDLSFGAPGLSPVMPGQIPLSGGVAGVSRIGQYSVTHLYEHRPPAERDKGGRRADVDTLYFGTYFMARHGQSGGVAVEVETASGVRQLVLLSRLPGTFLASNLQSGLEVVSVTNSEDGGAAAVEFYREAKRRVNKVIQRLRIAAIDAMPGQHCRWCDFGELCRRSHEFGETESLVEFEEEHD